MTNTLYSITPLVKPQTSGIIWMTKNVLTRETLGVYEINYLLNGLLIQSLESGLSQQDKNLYFSENFGNHFFIGHINASAGSTLESIYNFFDMVKDQLENHSEILFLCEEQNKESVKIFETLEKKFHDYQFHMKSLTE